MEVFDTAVDVPALSWGLKTPEQRGQDLRQAFLNIDPLKKSVPLPKGTYDFGDIPLVMPPNVVVESEDGHRSYVHLKCSAVWGSQSTMDQGKTPHPYASAFVWSNGTICKNLTFESTVAKNRQSTLFGFGIETKPSVVRRGYMEACTGKGGAWGGYFWHNVGDSFDIVNSDIYAGNVGVMLGKSVDNGQNVTVSKTRITIDPSLTTQGGTTTSSIDGGSIGIVVRGGNLIAREVFVNAVGQDVGRGPNICGIQDHIGQKGDGPSSQHLNMWVNDLTTLLNPFPGRTLADYYVRDIDRQFGELWLGGQASNNPDGSKRLRVAEMDRKPDYSKP